MVEPSCKRQRVMHTIHKELKEAIERGDYDKVKECADSGTINWHKEHYKKSWAQRAFKVRTTDSERITDLLVERSRAAGVNVDDLRTEPKRKVRGGATGELGGAGRGAAAPAESGVSESVCQGAPLNSRTKKKKKELSLRKEFKEAIDSGRVSDVKRLLAERQWDFQEKHYGRDWVERAYNSRCKEEVDKSEIIKSIVAAAGPTCSVPHDFRYMQLKTAIDEGNVSEVKRLLQEHVVWDWGKKFYGKTLVERAAKAKSTDGKARVLQMVLEASGQDLPPAKLKGPHSSALLEASAPGVLKKQRGGARVKKIDSVTGEPDRSQNHELKLAVEHGNLGAVNSLLEKYNWNWSSRHYGQNWLERVYTARPSESKGEIIKAIHTSALRSGATEYPLPPSFILSAFSEPAGPKIGRKRIGRANVQASEMKAALEDLRVGQVKDLLSKGDWDFSAEYYGHTWIERAMAIKPKSTKRQMSPGEFQQAKEEMLHAIFEAAFQSEIPSDLARENHWLG